MAFLKSVSRDQTPAPPAFGATMGIGATAGKIAVTHSGPDLFRVIRAAGG